MKKRSLALVAATSALLSANAAVITLQFPEVNGPEMTSGFPGMETIVGTEVFAIPAGETILSAELAGTFGATSEFMLNTAHHQVLIDGTEVISTFDVSPDPYANIVPFVVGVPIDLLTDGSATLSYIQLGEVRVRLSETTLTVITGARGVPDAASGLRLLGMGVAALGLARQRLRRA